jgi:hypothetical protein
LFRRDRFERRARFRQATLRVQPRVLAASTAAVVTLGTFRTASAAAAAVPPGGDPHVGGWDHGWLRGDHHVEDGERDLRKRNRNRKKAARAAVVQAARVTPLGATSSNCDTPTPLNSCSKQASAFYFSDTRNCDVTTSCNDSCNRKVCIDLLCPATFGGVSHVGVAGSCNTTIGAACVLFYPKNPDTTERKYLATDGAVCQVLGENELAKFVIKDGKECTVDRYVDPDMSSWKCELNQVNKDAPINVSSFGNCCPVYRVRIARQPPAAS